RIAPLNASSNGKSRSVQPQGIEAAPISSHQGDGDLRHFRDRQRPLTLGRGNSSSCPFGWRPMLLYSLISPARSSRRWVRKGRRTTARWSVSGDSTGGSNGFCQANVDRVGNISEKPIW